VASTGVVGVGDPQAARNAAAAKRSGAATGTEWRPRRSCMRREG
jgi:hypothetical protein